MREIKFRGIVKYSGNHYHSGEFVYGYYFHDKLEDKHYIKVNELDDMFSETVCRVVDIEVIPETVGQYIGVKHRDIGKYERNIFDKNGNDFRLPVYEDDIVEFKSNPSFYVNAKVGDRYIIENYGAGFFMKPIGFGKKLDAQNYVGLLNPYDTSNMSNHYEVIGNIHENKELLDNADNKN